MSACGFTWDRTGHRKTTAFKQCYTAVRFGNVVLTSCLWLGCPRHAPALLWDRLPMGVGVCNLAWYTQYLPIWKCLHCSNYRTNHRHIRQTFWWESGEEGQIYKRFSPLEGIPWATKHIQIVKQDTEPSHKGQLDRGGTQLLFHAPFFSTGYVTWYTPKSQTARTLRLGSCSHVPIKVLKRPLPKPSLTQGLWMGDRVVSKSGRLKKK